MKTLIAVASLMIVFASGAEANSTNSQRARQDREYKSLATATQRAYAVPKTTTSTPTYKSNKR